VKFSRTALSFSVSLGLAGLISSTALYAAEKSETADEFIARVNAEVRADYAENASASWLASTYINDDSQLVSSKANERGLIKLGEYVKQAKRFDIVADQGARIRPLLDENGEGGAARQRFQTERAGAGEEVEDAEAVEVRTKTAREDVEVREVHNAITCR